MVVFHDIFHQTILVSGRPKFDVVLFLIIFQQDLVVWDLQYYRLLHAKGKVGAGWTWTDAAVVLLLALASFCCVTSLPPRSPPRQHYHHQHPPGLHCLGLLKKESLLCIV
jgi:hypothetical protein